MRNILLILLAAVALDVHAALPVVRPQAVGFSLEQLVYADLAIEESIQAGEIPGAVLAVVRHGKIGYLRAYGMQEVEPSRQPMQTSTIFDMASCSKAMSTATCAMILYEQGLLDLEAPVSRYIPGFDDGQGNLQVRHLLTHTSGLPAYASTSTLLKKYGTASPGVLLQHICSVRRDFLPGQDFQYSCLNFITLQHIIERISGLTLRAFAQQHIFRPLKMKHTDYLPSPSDARKWGKRIAPTTFENGELLRGQVHDPLARIMNKGISGNAGVFSCAEDIAVFCAMLQNDGTWRGRRILRPETARLLRTVPDFAMQFGRSYGWDVCSAYSSCRGSLLSPETYCHTGFTGTSIVIDPINDVSIILLSNAVHPHEGKSGMIQLRKKISDIVAKALIFPPFRAEK